MGRIVVYGHTLSPAVRAVLLVTKAINLNVEYQHVDLFKNEHLSEDYRRKNVQHTVPTLEDEGKYIGESHAIVTYLIDKYAPDDSLYPKDLYKRALVNQRLAFDLELLYARLWNISMGIYTEKDTSIPKQKVDRVYNAYDFLELFLTADKFVTGNTMTVADLCCIASVSSMQGIAPVTPEKYPKLCEWIETMSKLPYYEEANGKEAAAYVQFLEDYMKKNAEAT